jgi:outer membrane protein assembly factor BamB
MVFAANEYAMANGITLGGTPEAVEATVTWEFDELLPEVSSPVGDGERFYYGTTVGDIVCLDAKTGENLWTQEVEDGIDASPILVGDRVYLADKSGIMYIFRASATYEELGKLKLGSASYATPAYLDKRMYVRTPEQLYCIEAP